MSKITVTTIAGATSGADANKVKIESGDTLEVVSNATVGGTLAIAGHGSVGNAGTVAGTRALTVVGATDGTSSSILVGYNSSLAQKFSVRDDGFATIGNGLSLTDGNLVVASGHGIDFSAGANAAGMTNELLDDYEEGTFTPNIGGSGVGYGTQAGSYRKIGSLVFVYLQISINTIGSPATTSGILSLPFTPTISNQYFGITYATGLNSNYYEIHGNFRGDGTIRIDGKQSNGSGQNSGINWAKNGAAIYGSGCYYTDA